MNRKQFIIGLIQTHREKLLQMGVKDIGIFGSVAKGEDLPTSDYDILVEFYQSHRNLKSFNALCDFLESNLGNNFDIVTRQGLSPYMSDRILQETEYVDIAQ